MMQRTQDRGEKDKNIKKNNIQKRFMFLDSVGVLKLCFGVPVVIFI